MHYEVRGCGSEWCPRAHRCDATPEQLAEEFVLDLADDDTRDGVVTVQVRAVFNDGATGEPVDYRVERVVTWRAERWGSP